MGASLGFILGALVGGTVGAYHVAVTIANYLPYVMPVDILLQALGI